MGYGVLFHQLFFCLSVDAISLAVVGVGGNIVLVGIHQELVNVVVTVGQGSYNLFEKTVEFVHLQTFYLLQIVVERLPFHIVHLYRGTAVEQSWLVNAYDVGMAAVAYPQQHLALVEEFLIGSVVFVGNNLFRHFQGAYILKFAVTHFPDCGKTALP